VGPAQAHRRRARRLEPDDRRLRSGRQLRAARRGALRRRHRRSERFAAAFSLLSDSFPAKRRATALAIYSSGIYIGAGLGIAVGGLVVQRWTRAFGAIPPLGLHGWQVAFFMVGLPGLLLSLWVATLREPRRGAADGIFSAPEAAPFRQFFLELRSVLPPFTILHLAMTGAGKRAIVHNSLLRSAWPGSPPPRNRHGEPGTVDRARPRGLSAFSWAQALGGRDPVAFELIFRSPALRYAGSPSRFSPSSATASASGCPRSSFASTT